MSNDKAKLKIGFKNSFSLLVARAIASLFCFGLVFAFSFLIFSLISAQEPEKVEECRTLQECKELRKKYEAKIAQVEREISQTRQMGRTLRNQITLLRREVEKLNLQIRQSNAIIRELGIEIRGAEESIDKTISEIENHKEILVTLLRTIYKENQNSYLEILLGGDELSDFFNHLTNLEVLNLKNQEMLGNVETAKALLENQKRSLEEDKADLERIVRIQTLQRKENENTKREKDSLLRLTERQYQRYVREKRELEEKVSEIIKRITQLTLPGMAVPATREELYELARWAANQTGIRPALILGLIEVESGLGVNVGQCNCAGLPNCRNPHLSYKDVMHRNHWVAFETICQELGLDPKSTPVSCAIRGDKLQWGGAMGIAQFMPNTWLRKGYKQRVEEITGIRPANPWRPADAFLAAALYLADWNANTQNREREKEAVVAYLCGTNIMTARCQRAGGVWYRNLVMRNTDRWQRWIDEGF